MAAIGVEGVADGSRRTVDSRGAPLIGFDHLAPDTVVDPSNGMARQPLSSAPSQSARIAMLDAVPVGILLIDAAAEIRFANVRIGEMLGVSRSEVTGRSVLDFVLLDDLDFVADLMTTGSDFGSQIMGPSRIRYVDEAGCAHWTQVWAYRAPPELGVDGFLIALTSESVRDLLVTAISSVAADDDLDETLAAIALSARAMPLAGAGVILPTIPSASGDEDRFRVIGDWPLGSESVNAFGTPWRRALVEGVDQDVEHVAESSLGLSIRDSLLEAGATALFVRPIHDIDGVIVGVYVVFRRETGQATVNQDDHVGDAVRLAALAFAQKRRRHELETTARRDALTGVSNRMAFNERLENDRRQGDVLFVDLDHFKAVNDTFGHHVGDQVVTEVAQRIALAVRRSDEVYRTGGDEFVVVCQPTGEDPAQRVTLAERIIERLMAPFDVEGHRVRIGATVGIAEASALGLNQTVRDADAALFTAKERGRAGWVHSHAGSR